MDRNSSLGTTCHSIVGVQFHKFDNDQLRGHPNFLKMTKSYELQKFSYTYFYIPIIGMGIKSREELGKRVYDIWASKFREDKYFPKENSMIRNETIQKKLDILVGNVFDEEKPYFDTCEEKIISLNHLMYLCLVKEYRKCILQGHQILEKITGVLRKSYDFSINGLNHFQNKGALVMTELLLHFLLNLCFYEDIHKQVKSNNVIMKKIFNEFLQMDLHNYFDKNDDPISYEVTQIQRLISNCILVVQRIFTLSLSEDGDFFKVLKFLRKKKSIFNFSVPIFISKTLLSMIRGHIIVSSNNTKTIKKGKIYEQLILYTFYEIVVKMFFSLHIETKMKLFSALLEKENVKFIEIAIDLFCYLAKSKLDIYDHSSGLRMELERDMLPLATLTFLRLSCSEVGRSADKIYEIIEKRNNNYLFLRKCLDIIEKYNMEYMNRAGSLSLFSTLSRFLKKDSTRNHFMNLVLPNLRKWSNPKFMEKKIGFGERNDLVLLHCGFANFNHPLTRLAYIHSLFDQDVLMQFLRYIISKIGRKKKSHIVAGDISAIRHVMTLCCCTFTKTNVERYRRLLFGIHEVDDEELFCVIIKLFYNLPMRVKTNICAFIAGIVEVFADNIMYFFERYHDPKKIKTGIYDLGRFCNTMLRIFSSPDNSNNVCIRRNVGQCVCKFFKYVIGDDFYAKTGQEESPGFLQMEEEKKGYGFEVIHNGDACRGNISDSGKKSNILCYYCKESKGKLKRCSGCKKVYYCSLKCQKKDWKLHKKYCKNI